MGLFDRVGNVMKGMLGKAVQELESQNVDALIVNMEEEIEKHKKEAEEQIIGIMTSAERIKIELAKAEKTLGAIRVRKESAVKVQDEELLVEILMMEQEAEADYNRIKAEYDTVDANVKKIKEDHKLFESEMRAKQRELEAMKSEAEMAKLKENMNALNTEYVGNSKGSELKEDMDRIRNIVDNKTARANAVESLGNESVEMKMRRLDANASRDAALAKAKELLGKKESDTPSA